MARKKAYLDLSLFESRDKTYLELYYIYRSIVRSVYPQRRAGFLRESRQSVVEGFTRVVRIFPITHAFAFSTH
jgi:hypothetical protein